jgi:hypothetical protein
MNIQAPIRNLPNEEATYPRVAAANDLTILNKLRIRLDRVRGDYTEASEN